MTIGDLIALLTEKAAALDESGLVGVDTSVRVTWCDGENLELTQEVDVDVMTFLRKDTTEVFLMVRGHPHREADGPVTMRGVAVDVDNYVAEWAKDGHPERKSDS